MPAETPGEVFERNGFATTDQRLRGTLFADGHCSRTGVRGLDRASWAVVEVNESAEVTACFFGAVSRAYPQTPQAAEYFAAVYAARAAAGPALLHDDCQNVVNDFGRPREQWLDEKRAYAGLMRIASEHDPYGELEVSKVKAHVDFRALVGRELFLAKGNDEADQFAGTAEKIHPNGDEAAGASINRSLRCAQAVVRVIAAVLPFWPFGQKTFSRRAVNRPAADVGVKRRLEPSLKHNWVREAQRWRCTICRAWASFRGFSDKRRHERCAGLTDRLAHNSTSSLGHKLLEVDSLDGRFTICALCGSYGAHKAVGLRAPCARHAATRRQKQALVRVLKHGRHPYTNRDIGRSRDGATCAIVPTAATQSERLSLKRAARHSSIAEPWAAPSLGPWAQTAHLDESGSGASVPAPLHADPDSEDDVFGHNAAGIDD